MGKLILAVAFAALVPAAAAAKGGFKDLLEEAKGATRASEHLKAAGLYGQALALTQKQGDLVDEQECAEALFEFLGRLPSPAIQAGKETASTNDRRSCLVAVMQKLDPKRCGAFVSAPGIAEHLLLEAIEKGDGRFVDEAAATLGPHMAGGKSGKGLGALARLAMSVKEARGEAAGGADAGLQFVIGRAGEEGWTDMALAAAVEQVVLRLKLGDNAKATESVTTVARLVPPDADPRLRAFAATAMLRLVGTAPEEVLKPWTDALSTSQSGKGSASGRGGAGGKGQDAGAEPISPVGAHLRNQAKRAPLGTVVRTTEGFEFRVPWDPKFKGVLEVGEGVRHLDEGGLTLAFCGWGVSVRMLDTVGTSGQPGEGSTPEAGRPFYRLARGETWALAKDGSVQVSGK